MQRQAYSVAIYPRYQGKALLIKHLRLGVWLPPGGECEEGETPLQAARRELLEETGLVGSFPVISPIEGVPPGLLGYEEHIAGAKGLHKNFVFVADVDHDHVVSNGEFKEYCWTQDCAAFPGPRNVAQFLTLALSAHPLQPT